MASWESRFREHYLFLVSLGRDGMGFSPLITTISAFKIYLLPQCPGGRVEVVIYTCWSCGICLLHFLGFYFLPQQLRLKNKMFSLLIHISKIPSLSSLSLLTLPNFCLPDWKRKSGREHFEILLFSIVFVLLLLYFPPCIFQLIAFCLVFAYFKVKTWIKFHIFSESFISLERYFFLVMQA